MRNDRDMGAWILPQPPKTKEYVKIPKPLWGAIPYGYSVDPDDPTMLLPIESELDALAKAKEFLKRYTYVQVAAWLTKETGRSITPYGLQKRVKRELSYKRKATLYRGLARRYAEAIEAAIKYEKLYNKAKNYGKYEEVEYNPETEYIGIQRLLDQLGTDRDD